LARSAQPGHGYPSGNSPKRPFVGFLFWPARAAKRSTTKVSDALYSRRPNTRLAPAPFQGDHL